MKEQIQPTIRVAIGDQEVTYHITETNAPKDYDGFGTIELVADMGASREQPKYNDRLVLIRDEHHAWQTARYQSGWHGVKTSDLPLSSITEVLWKRLARLEP